MKSRKALLGIVLMVLSVFLFSLKDAFAKSTDGYYSAVLIIWLQFASASMFYFPVITWRYGIDVLRPRAPGWQILRSAMVVIGIGSFYWAISLIPLAEATAMSFTAPLIVTAISPLLLNEKIGIRRWLSVIVGFFGVLIILRPDFGGDRLGYLIALGSGVFVGLSYAMNRKLAKHAPTIVSVGYSSIIGALLLTPLVPGVWVAPRPDDYYLILGFCIIAAMGQALLFSAFMLGEASIIAPFHYVQIVGATLYGYLFFNDFPDTLTIIGITIVIACGVYIALREAKANTPLR
ncbi:DMT family transporter [Pseudomonadota bacterium]